MKAIKKYEYGKQMTQGDTYKCTIDRPTIYYNTFIFHYRFIKWMNFQSIKPINQITILIKNIKKQHNITNPTW